MVLPSGGRYRPLMNQSASLSFGDHLRSWRQRRRLSQLDLALDTEISARHLSFLETGRSRPSREMVLRLAERLQVPLRERNTLLVAAGHAPVYGERPLGDPAAAAVRAAVEQVLKGHEPYPALAVDRGWTLVAANAAVPPLLEGVDPELLRPPVNVLRLSFHPRGLAPRVRNLSEWRGLVLARLAAEADASGDAGLAVLLEELRGYPAPAARAPMAGQGGPALVVPFQLEVRGRVLDLISTTTVFGTPLDVTVSELAIESFFPANDETAAFLRHMTAP